MAAIVITVLVGTALLCGGWALYSKLNPEKYTRERYAFNCLSAAVSLAGVAVAAVSSKQGVFDQVFGLIAATLGYPPPAEQPAPLSEKTLIVLLVVSIIYMLFKSHREWNGLISEDDALRQRSVLPISMFEQGIDEFKRLAKRLPPRNVAGTDRRLKGDVNAPPAPAMVWHEHARELFELWFSARVFDDSDDSIWDARVRCWLGRDQRRGEQVFLFCLQNRPTSVELADLEKYANDLSHGNQFQIFAVHREKGDLDKIVQGNDVEIQVLSETYLLNNLVDFSDYFREIERRVEASKFPETGKTILDIYVPSGIKSNTGQTVSGDLGQYLRAWASNPENKHLAVLGEYGQGKSTGLIMFVYEAVKSGLASSGGRIPILFELRGKSPSNMLPQELIATWAQQFRISPTAVMNLLIAGRLILIFEGFDEMANVANVESRLSHFRVLWQLGFPGTKMVFTGRPNLFFEDRELDIVFKTTDGNGTSTSCEILRLEPFSIDKIATSLRWTDDKTRQEIMHSARSNAQILDIVSRPSLLYIVAALWEELQKLFASGQMLSAQVIDRFVLHSYERQAEKEKLQNFMVLTTSERRYFHEGLAVYMASTGATNQISGADLGAVIRRLYQSYPPDSHIIDNVYTEKNYQPLRKRFEDQESAIEAITTDVHTHGILVNDVARRGTFKFAHKSFYELLAAKSYANHLLDIEPIFYRAIYSAMSGNMGNPTESNEALRFFAEILISELASSKLKESDIPDLSNRVFDLVARISDRKSFVRNIIRNAYFYARQIENSYKLIAALLIVTFVSLLASRFDIFSDSPIGLDFFVTKDKNISSKTIVTTLTSILTYLIAIMQFSMIFSTFGQRNPVKLWASVLLQIDDVFSTDHGRKEIRRRVGERAARRLEGD